MRNFCGTASRLLLSFIVLVFLLSSAAPSPLQAAAAQLVADLATDSEYGGVVSAGPIVLLRDRIFFFASEPSTGTELWVSDGTTHGTRLLADLCPGPCSPDIEILGDLEGILMVAADQSLWRSDGTRDGTFRLTVSGEVQSGLASPTILGSFLYFSYCQPVADCELWRTDGTRDGTGLFEDPSPGGTFGYLRFLTTVGDSLYFVTLDALRVVHDGAPSSSLVKSLPDAFPTDLVAAGDRLFFLATDDGRELWTSDGTTAGTLPVTRFAPKEPFPSSFEIKPAGESVVFAANDGTHGNELWQSDGTPGGTRPITDFDDAFANLSDFRVLGNRVLVWTVHQGRSGLWVTTGAPQSLALLPLPCCNTIWSSRDFHQVGDRVVFQADDGVHGLELWTTDGTAAGTRLLKDFCPGSCDALVSGSPGTRFLVSPEEILFVTARPRTTLWRTDGTPEGTLPLTGPGFSFDPLELEAAAVDRRVVFWGWGADDSIQGLWESDDSGNPRLLAALPNRTPASSSPDHLTALGSRVVFTTCDHAQSRIWQTEGTPETTSVLQELPISYCVDGLHPARGLVFFIHEGLWRTDGTPKGTLRLTEDVAAFSDFAELAGRVFFPARQGREIWRSDGTPEGTEAAAFLRQDAFDAAHLTVIGKHLYFLARRPGGDSLWRSDGTDAGTHKLADFPYRSRSAPDFTQLGSRIFFLAADRQVWRTDGTPGGTSLVFTAGGIGAYLSDLMAFQGSLYFFVDSRETRELWRSDGTPQGTARLREFAPREFDPDDSSRHHLTVFDGRLFFVADDGVHGEELWASDGTAAGTAMVRDISPGPASSDPREIVEAAGRLFFTAHDGAHGAELWRSDGTAASTRLIQDLAPEGFSSFPRELTLLGSRLFFSAYEPLTGRELWVLPLAGPACQPSSTRLCLNDGRFQVEAVWRDFADNTGTGTAVPLSEDTGYFWFFAPDNVEAVLKVLDGRGFNNHFWVFYGALSNVEYTLTVTDTQTGLARRYFNPLSQLASVGDTSAFGRLGAHSNIPDLLTAPPSPPTLVSGRTDPAAATGACTPGPQRLCLNGGRFAVEASWKDFQGNTGRGTAVSLTADTGWFWFFDSSNVEVMLKVLDGTPLNGKFWVFYGALSNVEYTLTVTDTQTGAVKEYRNPSGRFASVADTGAF